MSDNESLARTIFQTGIDRKDYEYTSLILGVSKDKFHLFTEFVKMVEENARGIVEKNVPLVSETIKTETRPQVNPKRNYVKNGFGNFSSREEMIEALKEFASKKDEDGVHIPYSRFAKENNIPYHTINNIVHHLQLSKKYPRNAGRKSMALARSRLGKFSSFDDFDKSLAEFSKKTDPNGIGYPYSLFAEKYDLDIAFVYSRAYLRGYSKLVPRKKGNIERPILPDSI